MSPSNKTPNHLSATHDLPPLNKTQKEPKPQPPKNPTTPLPNKKSDNLFPVFGLPAILAVGITIVGIAIVLAPTIITIIKKPTAQTKTNSQTQTDNSQTDDPANTLTTPRSLITQPTSPVADEPSLAIKSLTETYLIPNANPYYSSRDGRPAGGELTIDQIEILKDQTIQSKINQEFQSACNNASSKEKNYEYAYLGCHLSPTPGDTISFVTYLLVPYTGKVIPNEYSDEYDIGPIPVPRHVTTKNYRLDTGKEIHFDDLFVAGTDLTPILTKAAHEAVHCITTHCGGGGLESYADIPDVDAEVLRIIQNLRNTKDISFSFNNRDITVWIENYSLTIRMSEWYDKITIFKRFKSPENPFIVEPAAPQFIFSTSTANYKNEFVSDNLFARVDAYQGGFNNSPIIPDAIIAKRNALIEVITDQAIARVQNKNGIHLLDFAIGTSALGNDNYQIYISATCSWDGTSFEYCTNLYSLPFEQSTKDNAISFIASAARNPSATNNTLFLNNIPNDTNFWTTMDGYVTDTSHDHGFSSIVFYYDASGNPIENPNE